MAVSTFTKAQAWRGTDDDALVGWVELYHVDEDGLEEVFRWSMIPVAGPSTYLEPRVLSFGFCERALSDRNGHLESSVFAFEVADTDNLCRAFLANVNQKHLRKVQVVVKVQRWGDLWQGNDPFVVFRGLVKRYKALAGGRFSFQCQDWLSSRIHQDVKLNRIGSAFPEAADPDAVGPLWYGRLSDENSVETGPAFEDEAASGMQAVGIAGHGERNDLDAPTGMTVTEQAGASDFLLGDDVLILVTAVYDGVESDPFPFLDDTTTPITGDTNKLRVEWDDMSADAYRVYVGHIGGGGPAIDYAVEVSGATLLYDVESFTAPPGAISLFVPTIWYYGVAAVMSDGETVIVDECQSVNTGLRRPRRIVFSQVADALEYHVYRRGAAGAYDRRWTVDVAHTNADGDVFFEDSQLDDDPTLVYVTGAPEPRGVVPCRYVGMIPDLGGTARHACVVAAHAISAVINLYLETGGVATVVPGGNYGTDYAAPGRTGFASFYPEVYHDAADGTRWALVYILNSSIGADVADGTSTLWANIDGVEDAGDGTGDCILSFYQQVLHFLKNYGLPVDSYAGGLWLAAPEWADASDKINEVSFDDVETLAETQIGDTVGAWGVVQRQRLLELIAELMISGDMAYGQTREGALRVVLEDPYSAAVAADTYTEENDIFENSFDWDDETDPSWLYNRESYQATPQYTLNEGIAYRDTGFVEDLDAQAEAGEVLESPTPVSFLGRRASVAQQIVARRVDRSKTPPRRLSFDTGMPALIERELGDVVGVSHSEGTGDDGWSSALFMIRRVRLDLGVVSLGLRGLANESLLDYEIEELGMEYPLGGSLVHSPLLTGSSPQTVYPYDPPGASVMVPWSIIPAAAVVIAHGQAQVEAGVTSIQILVWDDTDNVQVGASATITANTLTSWSVTITRPENVNHEYSMRATVIGGSADLSVQFKGKIRVTI